MRGYLKKYILKKKHGQRDSEREQEWRFHVVVCTLDSQMKRKKKLSSAELTLSPALPQSASLHMERTGVILGITPNNLSS